MNSHVLAFSEPPAVASGAAKRLMFVLSVAAFMVLFAAAIPAPIRAAWDEFALRIQLKSESQSASPAKLSDHEIEEIAALPAQQQAERLLERAINHYDRALELIGQSCNNSHGQLHLHAPL